MLHSSHRKKGKKEPLEWDNGTKESIRGSQVWPGEVALSLDQMCFFIHFYFVI